MRSTDDKTLSDAEKAEAEALAEKIRGKAKDALAGLDREMRIMKWPAEFRAVLWGVVGHMALLRGAAAAAEGEQK